MKKLCWSNLTIKNAILVTKKDFVKNKFTVKYYLDIVTKKLFMFVYVYLIYTCVMFVMCKNVY